MSEPFEADWLELREPFDARARNAALAIALAEALPPRPHLLDLGAGTGSLLRWLAPILGRSQFWTLVDADAALLQRAFATIEERAILAGWTTTWPRPTTLLVHTPQGVWRVEGLVADLAAGPGALPLDKADGVVSTALCDLVSHRWVRQMAGALRVPFYAALNVDGRDRFSPPHPADGLVARGFRRDQGRDKGFGRALGPAAPAVMARAFRGAGFRVQTGPSPWFVPGATPVMADTLAEGHAQAARAALPQGTAPLLRGWAEARRAQARRGRLSVRIGHTDLLALPPH
ncbi:class I SAM-dependent methyltransferase [Pseudoroseomonas cervicalis]|uniref:class I SAM-dependent methyltransferase n=1 Tax=Teichococcus cervicalis TaxID=204525 RepID=UPI0022F1746E|nr:class I SAM-dependent methyltransferase [Pseudoroseomonas cervicalis]WBV42146.1 class I SAM-dependent methyltransferase [Pseudoroseomonas cervicalis]